MLKILEKFLGKWFGWRNFWDYFFYGAGMTFGAFLGFTVFYYLCVAILLLEPAY